MSHSPTTLYFLCGLPFAGKSTLARTQARHIALDAVNTKRGLGLDGATITPEQWDQTYAEVYRRIEAALAASDSAIYDETCFLRAQRDAVRAIAARAGARCQLI